MMGTFKDIKSGEFARRANGKLKAALYIMAIFSLLAAWMVFDLRKQAGEQKRKEAIRQEELMRALRAYDSLAAIRLYDVAREAHPERARSFHISPVDTVKLKNAIEQDVQPIEEKK